MLKKMKAFEEGKPWVPGLCSLPGPLYTTYLIIDRGRRPREGFTDLGGKHVCFIISAHAHCVPLLRFRPVEQHKSHKNSVNETASFRMC